MEIYWGSLLSQTLKQTGLPHGTLQRARYFMRTSIPSWLGQQNETKELCLKTNVPCLIVHRGHSTTKQESGKSEVCRVDENIGGFCVALFSLEMDDQLAEGLDAALRRRTPAEERGKHSQQNCGELSRVFGEGTERRVKDKQRAGRLSTSERQPSTSASGVSQVREESSCSCPLVWAVLKWPC